MILCFSIVRFFCSYSRFQYLTNIDSGHGGQIEDQDGDEMDGFDEGLLRRNPCKIGP